MTTRSTAAAPNAELETSLTQCLFAMAGTPDDSCWITSQLITIVHLTAEILAPGADASATVYRPTATPIGVAIRALGNCAVWKGAS